MKCNLNTAKPSLWASWMSAYHLQHTNIWTVVAKDSDSWTWKSIIKIRDELSTLLDLTNITNIMQSTGGEYSTTNIYNLLRRKAPAVTWNTLIWGGLNVSRCSFITWLASHQRLPTLSKLHKWGIAASDTCKLCNISAETEDHLWLDCSYTNSVLDIILKWLRIETRFQNLNEWYDWLANDTKHNSFLYKFRCSCLSTFVYFTWRARNNLLHQNVPTTVEECAKQVICSMKATTHANWTRNNRSYISWKTTLSIES